MSAKFIPGPYEFIVPVHPKNSEDALDVAVAAKIGEKFYVIAECYGQVATNVFVDAKTQAYLFKAAPNLYTATEKIYEAIKKIPMNELHPGLREEISFLLLALKQARGEI